MRSVVIVGAFPAEMVHFDMLARSLDLVVYGSTTHMPGYPYQPQPPQVSRSRTFEPFVLRNKGHLGWVYKGLFSALDSDQPDVVHVVSEPWGSLAIQAAAWARRRGFRGLVIHGCDQKWYGSRGRGDFKRRPRIAAARFSLTAASGFAGLNSPSISQALRGGLRPEAPTSVINANPRDPSRFRPPSHAERTDARRSLELPSDGIGIGLLGRLVPEKGSGVFLDAWPLVRRRLPKQHTWAAIAGGGPLESELRRRADDSVTIRGPLQFPDEAVRFLQSVDVFVHPPWSTPQWAEQGARVLIEAMLTGCLIVASDSGANREMLGDAAFLVPESDAARLAEAILEAIQLAERSPQMHPARQKAVEEYSDEAVAQKHLDLWSRVLEAS